MQMRLNDDEKKTSNFCACTNCQIEYKGINYSERSMRNSMRLEYDIIHFSVICDSCYIACYCSRSPGERCYFKLLLFRSSFFIFHKKNDKNSITKRCLYRAINKRTRYTSSNANAFHTHQKSNVKRHQNEGEMCWSCNAFKWSYFFFEKNMSSFSIY